ncbi:hypothetical protein CF319_g9004 [Tilletia indica]|nr:hypothetical protein CF319_g9004 [Tilletia indica]
MITFINFVPLDPALKTFDFLLHPHLKAANIIDYVLLGTKFFQADEARVQLCGDSPSISSSRTDLGVYINNQLLSAVPVVLRDGDLLAFPRRLHDLKSAVRFRVEVDTLALSCGEEHELDILRLTWKEMRDEDARASLPGTSSDKRVSDVAAVHTAASPTSHAALIGSEAASSIPFPLPPSYIHIHIFFSRSTDLRVSFSSQQLSIRHPTRFFPHSIVKQLNLDFGTGLSIAHQRIVPFQHIGTALFTSYQHPLHSSALYIFFYTIIVPFVSIGHQQLILLFHHTDTHFFVAYRLSVADRCTEFDPSLSASSFLHNIGTHCSIGGRRFRAISFAAPCLTSFGARTFTAFTHHVLNLGIHLGTAPRLPIRYPCAFGSIHVCPWRYAFHFGIYLRTCSEHLGDRLRSPRCFQLSPEFSLRRLRADCGLRSGSGPGHNHSFTANRDSLRLSFTRFRFSFPGER